MPQTIKLSDDTMAVVRAAAAAHSRSLAGQAEHWIKLGAAIESDPKIRFKDIDAVLRGEKSLDLLSGDQQEAFFEAFGEVERNRTPDDAAAFAHYMRKRHQVGYLSHDSDEIVTRPPRDD